MNLKFSWKLALRPFELITVVLVFILDQVSKYVVKTHLGLGESHRLLPYFNLVHTKNRGAAFGMFHDSSPMFRIFFFGAVTVICLYLLLYWLGTTPLHEKIQRFALALILGGALGNVLDRLVYAEVTDFLDVFYGSYHWPAFNVADSGITVGVTLIFIKLVPWPKPWTRKPGK